MYTRQYTGDNPSREGMILQRIRLTDHTILSSDPRNGPAFDLELLRKIMAANDLPLVLPFMCRDAREVSTGNLSVVT